MMALRTSTMVNQAALLSEDSLWSAIVYGSLLLLLVRVARHFVGESNLVLRALSGFFIAVLVLAVLAVGYQRLL